jgi:phage terminase large subunit
MDNPSLNKEDFHINENEMRILYVPTGNMIMSKGARKDGSRTAKLKSLAGATHILIEEADELGREDFEQMDLSVRTIKTAKLQIIRIFNPPHKQHWIWDNYQLKEASEPGYFNATPLPGTGVLSIFSTYYDNLRNINATTAEKFERYRERNPEYYWTIVRGLISEGAKGRIFNGWSACSNDEFNAVDAKPVVGLDWGTSSPAAMVECKFHKSTAWLRELNYLPMTTKEIAIFLVKKNIGSILIIADSAEPLSISKLRRGWEKSELTAEEIELYPQLLRGFNINAALKGPGSIMAGISKIKEMTVYYTAESINLKKEYEEYRWALDRNKDPTDMPDDSNNHCIDCIRYPVLSRGRHF